MSEGQTIGAIFAWVVTEPDGGEGVATVIVGDMAMPLIGADMDRMKSIRFLAASIREATGCPVQLVRFGPREDLEVLP